MQAGMSPHENTIVQTEGINTFCFICNKQSICLKPATRSLRRGSPQADMKNTQIKNCTKDQVSREFAKKNQFSRTGIVLSFM